MKLKLVSPYGIYRFVMKHDRYGTAVAIWDLDDNNDPCLRLATHRSLWTKVVRATYGDDVSAVAPSCTS